ncbi:MAG TPA: hypothetical protein VM715_08740, partial [Candidatus Acidoferrum sp.]|nr:hypothetical protein [Candidatus Acidoferrum sp.]
CKTIPDLINRAYRGILPKIHPGMDQLSDLMCVHPHFNPNVRPSPLQASGVDPKSDTRKRVTFSI